MSDITYDTPCFYAFIELYNLQEAYCIIKRPIKNVVFFKPEMEDKANVFVSGYNAALKNTKKFQ